MKFNFLQRVAKLSGGNALAQVPFLLAAPALSRMYEPAEFALLSLLMACQSIATPIVSGRYEMAVPATATDDEAKGAVGAAFLVGAVTCSGLALLALLLRDQIGGLFTVPGFREFVLWLPVLFFSYVLFNALYYFFIRKDRLGFAVMGRATRGFAMAGAALGLGWAGHQHGLAAALLISWGLAAMVGIALAIRLTSWRLQWARVRAALRLHWRLPVQGSVPGALEAVSIMLPVLLLSRHFSADIAGQYGLINQFVVAPMALMANATSQLLLRDIGQAYAHGEAVAARVRRMLGTLCAVVGPPMLVAPFVAQEVVVFVFGDAWAMAGLFVEILAIPLAIRFISSAFSTVLFAIGQIRWFAAYQIASFLLYMLLFLAVEVRPTEFVTYIGVVMSLAGLLLLAAVYWLAGRTGSGAVEGRAD